MTIKHATQTAKPNDASKDVSANAWNADHVVIGYLIDVAHGTTTITTGNSYIDVVHNAGAVPSSYSITPLSIEGAIWFIDNETINSFRLNLFSIQEGDASFKWRLFE